MAGEWQKRLLGKRNGKGDGLRDALRAEAHTVRPVTIRVTRDMPSPP
jgi:hypothetical protein